MEKEKETELKILGKMHINYKDWQKFSKYAKANNIRTIAELEMYCRVHNVRTELDLFVALANDYTEVLFENHREQTNRILKGVQNGNY